MCGSAITDIWSPLERETTYSGPGQVLLPTWDQALEILSNFRLFPLKRRFGRNVDWSRKGRLGIVH